MTPVQLLKSQKIISTKHFQSQFASVAREAAKNKKFYNIVRNSESIGVFLPKRIWESLLEDIEALNSPKYLKAIAESTAQADKGELLDIDEAFDV
jgi:PHD/YefM family antitoxin component YafN of YafNO toxin-antitoxin module